jgi:hypothetical protein
MILFLLLIIIYRGLGACPPDLEWITNWVSLGHLHIAILLAVLAKSAHGNPAEEVKLSYLVAGILCIEIAVGIISKPHLDRLFLMVQLIVWMVKLACLGSFTYTEYDEPLQIQTRGGGRTPTPRELHMTVSRLQGGILMGGVGSVPGTPRGSMTPRGAFDGRSSVSVVTIALIVIVIGALIQTLELVVQEDKSSHYAGASANFRYVYFYFGSYEMAFCNNPF